jgi:6-phosphogluconolactonase (cycloisomerase 2 family)
MKTPSYPHEIATLIRFFGFRFRSAVDPLGTFVFVANFGDNNVSAYAIGSNGGLIPVPGAPFVAGFALGEMILQSVSGRHLSPFTIALA